MKLRAKKLANRDIDWLLIVAYMPSKSSPPGDGVLVNNQGNTAKGQTALVDKRGDMC